MAEEVTLAPPPAARGEASPGSWREAFPTLGARGLFLVALACHATVFLAAAARGTHPALLSAAPWAWLRVLALVGSAAAWLMVLERSRRVGEDGWELGVAVVLVGPVVDLSTLALGRSFDDTLFTLRQVLGVVGLVASLVVVPVVLRLAVRARDVRPSPELLGALWAYPVVTFALLLAPGLAHAFLQPPQGSSAAFFAVASRAVGVLVLAMLVTVLAWAHHVMGRPRPFLMAASMALAVAHVLVGLALASVAFGARQEGTDAVYAQWEPALGLVHGQLPAWVLLLAALALTLSPRAASTPPSP